MAWLIHRVVTWLLVLAMPFHVLTAVYLDFLGPAHFHVDDETDEHAHGHAHAHGHDHFERHHHHPNDPTVVAAEEDALLDALAFDESTASGWSATMVAALVAADAALHLPQSPSGLAPGQDPLLHTRFLGRLERPPRTART
jgi:hypothetical protein